MDAAVLLLFGQLYRSTQALFRHCHPEYCERRIRRQRVTAEAIANAGIVYVPKDCPKIPRDEWAGRADGLASFIMSRGSL